VVLGFRIEFFNSLLKISVGNPTYKINFSIWRLFAATCRHIEFLKIEKKEWRLQQHFDSGIYFRNRPTKEQKAMRFFENPFFGARAEHRKANHPVST
jgi:hypothetical protein